MLTLEALLDAAAEIARETFDSYGEVEPVWIADANDGELRIIVADALFSEDKEAAFAAVSALFKLEGVRTVCFHKRSLDVDRSDRRRNR